MPHAITHLLLDIEGTTCPVSFVAQTLFPYARKRLRSFLEIHANNTAVQKLLVELEETRRIDPGPTQELNREGLERTTIYLEWLIDLDRKVTALKQLQGLIWEEGYASGELQSPLFNDVPDFLNRARREGIELAVYSSGSISAQKMLYSHSQAGNLSNIFSDWFDTTTGPKNEPASYLAIARKLKVPPKSVLFISDSKRELDASVETGMKAMFSNRLGNPEQDPGPYQSISNFADLRFNTNPT